jgi:hypothetical protein
MVTTVYDSKRLMAVPIPGIANLMYGFNTNVKDATSTELGHVPAIAASGGDNNGYIANLIIGANKPKPMRASKPGGSSSYIDAAKAPTLRGGNWNISPAKYASIGKSAKSKIVYVEIGFVKYAWHIPNFLFNQAAFTAAMTALGITLATNNDRDLVLGADYPKPPRAKFTAVVGDEVNSYSSFVAPLKIDNLPDGWSLSDPGNYPISFAI